MNNLKNVFYLYATLSSQGIIQDIGGKVFDEVEIEAQNLIGQRFSDLIFWQQNEATSQIIANSTKVAGEGKPLEIETHLRLNATTISTITATFNPTKDDQNQVNQIFFSSVDVTGYTKEIDYFKTQSDRFLFAAESAKVGLWFWDLDKEDIFTTPRCNEIFGYPPNKILLFEEFAKVFHPQDSPNIYEAIKESQTNLTDYDIEYRIILESGEIRWVALRGKTFNEGEASWIMMGSVRDITQRKMTDDRLQQLVVIEKNARDEVEEANRSKDHFMALVSHELRTPLNSILGWAKILRTKEVDQSTHQKALETIEKSASFQAKMLSDLVDSTKIISGKMNLSLFPLALKVLISGIYHSQKPVALEKKINFVLKESSDVTISGDAKRLQQVFSNLISNSIKFTPEGGEIFINLREENNQAVFEIKDSGPGVPEEDLSSIFKSYYQVKGSHKKGGLGLGLSIVKAIVEKHGGKVSVENNKDTVGCKFTVSFPISLNQISEDIPNSPLPDKESANSLENISILIVEDTKDSREVLHFYLSQMGAEVHSVSSSQEGLAYLTSTHQLPKVIISDISMPEEDGYTFIRQVRDLPLEMGRDIPAIALTAFASLNDQQKSLDSGFQRHHSKPFEPDLLVNEILEVVSRI